MIFEGTKKSIFFGLGLTRAGYNYPSIDMLVSISEYFKCDLDYLIGQQSMPNKEFSHIADMIGISDSCFYFV